MSITDPLTEDLESKTRHFLSLVEEPQSPIKNSLSDVPQLRDAYSELKNIARAIDQYSRTHRGLRYIGLLGTFSSGKSSIINSLLGQEVRQTDLPPIDNEITILSHPANREALMGAHSRGLLRVTTQPVAAELLKNCFLVDTPGSGDPEVREGMIRDFLPVCDLILYTFPATSALNSADLSVLRTLQDELDFVPIRFVVTRADEFRANRDLPVSDENMNKAKLDGFLASLIGRIRAQAPNLDLATSRFSFVDNLTKFGIARLKMAVLNELDSDVQLHSKKIAYFRRGLSSQKATFEQYLSKLLADVSQLEHTAKQNKQKYENNINVSFQSINEFWRPREGAQTTRTSNFGKVVEKWGEIEQISVTDFGSKWTDAQKVQSTIEQRAKEFSEDIRHLVLELEKKEVHYRREELNAQFSSLIKQRTTIASRGLPPDARIHLLAALTPNIARALRSTIEVARAEALNEIKDKLWADETWFGQFFEHVKRGDLASKDHEYYTDFAAVIRSNLKEFLPIVQLFKATVTSAQARNLISRTGLGEQLDQLDSVDVDLVAANEQAELFLETVFAARRIKHDALGRSAGFLLERKDVIETAIQSTNIEVTREHQFAIDIVERGALESHAEQLLRPLIDRAIAAAEADIATAHANWNSALQDAVKQLDASLHIDRLKFVRTWLDRFKGVLAIGGFVGVLILAALLVTGYQQKIGWALTILSSGLASVAGSVFRWAWENISAGSLSLWPKPQWRVVQEMVSKSEPRLEHFDVTPTIDQALTEIRVEYMSALKAFVRNDKEMQLPRYRAIAERERELITTEANNINLYVDDWTALANSMNEWYRPDELKKTLITNAANAIKQNAIEPALFLFAERLAEVRNFSERLHALSI